MKKQILLAAMMSIAMTCSAAVENALDVFLREDRVPLGSPVELGVWNGDLDACKALADKRGIPMIAVWSNRDCGHCEILERAFHSNAFRNWAKTCGMVLCFTCSDDPHGKSEKSESDRSRYKFFCKISPSGTLSDFPFVRFYWYTNDGKRRVVDYNVKGDTVDKQQGIYMKSYDKAGNICIDYIMNTSGFGAYVPKPAYLGGVFDVPAVDASDVCAQLQAEPTTKTVYVPMKRDFGDACEQTLTIADVQANGGNGIPVSWAEGETNKTIEIANFNTDWYKKGHVIVVTAENDDGDVESQVTITCVDVQPNTADNPYWIGEKTELAFGEWTMDLAAAKALAKGATGEAYTLVALLGSLWCHDCANTARNFLDVEDAGVNKFKAWAAKKQVALVTADIPNFTDPEGAFESPCLLSRTAYTSTLAYEMPAYGMYDVSKGGAPESLTKATLRSGLGYLTRKGVTDEAALAQLAVVHDLAVKDTAEGGFHRPEDTNKNRTGVPIFVLLRKDGTVAARFTRFASASPMAADQANFDNYIKRFEEMLALAASTGNHADPSEIENNYPGDRAISFAANGGTASNELCNADFQDAFKLTGVGGNADQKVTVKGESDAQVSVQFWQKAADGSFKTLGNEATGKLSDGGVDLTQSFTEGGDYYLLVKGVDITSAAFDAASSTANHFIGFEVKGSTVLVPQEDRVTANAPAGSTNVLIRLMTDTVYCFSGVTTNDNPFLVEVAEASPFRFLKSKVSGDVELKISTGPGGEISYQIWKPGQVGFVDTMRSVPESVNDQKDDWVEFKISRTGGKSGRVKARVTVNLGETTLDPSRYVFQTNALNAADFLWEDGVTSNMTARVKIIDDIFYDGDFKVVFDLEVLASDAGDVDVKDSRGAFTLTVEEDDKQEPGKAFFCGTDPDFARKGVVYARKSEGAKIFAKRVESFDGLVAGVINSSVSGADFKTEDDRDLERLADIAPELVEQFPKYKEAQVLYWSSHEDGEKFVRVSGIPAGKTAKVTFTPVNMETVSASNAVTIVSVADDAPGFVRDASSFDLFRFVACGDSAKVEIDPGFLQGGKVTFTKLSGTLPAGLKAEYNAKALVFSGVPTAKSGTYTVVYQVVETRDGTTRVPGLTTMVTFTVVDPADVKTNPEGANPAVAKSRTLKDLMVVDSAEKRLLGMLQLTIPSNGKLSGKLVCADGSIALTAKSWSNFIPKSRTLFAELAGKKGFAATVTVADDWSVRADLTKDGDFYGFAESDGIVWSKTNPASDWQGYYTVILPNAGIVREGTTGIAALGTAYVTLKMNTASSANAGKMIWAGLLPNGTAISGSTVLTRGEDVAWMPLYKASSKELISGAFEIAADAVASSNRTCVIEKDGAQFFWKHVEKTPTACFEVNLDAFGSYYDSKNDDLASCCEEAYQGSRTLGFFAGNDKLASVMVSEKSIQLSPEQENPTGLKLSLSRSTGIVSGSFKLDGVPCSYKGVILIGWGGIGCNCGEEPIPFKPFVGGAYYYSYKHEYFDLSLKRQRSLNMKCGDAIRIEADKK